MKEKRSSNKLKRVLTCPIRALAKARDLYVKSMNTYADTGYYAGGASSFGMAVSDPLPRSFSDTSRGASGHVDLKDLIRASSKSRADKLDHTCKGAPRSASVAMAKIDEDEPCDVRIDENVFGMEKKSKGLFSRSKSYDVVRRF